MALHPEVLPLTGERTVPGIAAENYWFRRHEAAYEFARTEFTRTGVGGRVLEVGCGEGYGTALLAPASDQIVGLDYDAMTVAHAAAAYPQARFVRANLAALPVRAESVDAVVTLQVIEHVWNQPEFVAECLRVLRPGGLLLVTTPNRLTFSPGRDVPVNPFHTKEFTSSELVDLLRGGGFGVEAELGLHAGSRLRHLDDVYGSFVGAQLDLPPQAWSPALRADVASVATDDFDIHSQAVDSSLDLVVLARRPR